MAAAMNLISDKGKMGDEIRQDRTPPWRNKADMAKKHEILREIKQLDIKLQNMDREKATHLYSKRNDFRQDFAHLEDIDLKLSHERKTEKIKTKQQLDKIRNMVRRFRRELQDVKPTPEFVEKLKIIMEDIESTVSAFKEQQRDSYEEMMREERIAMQEISTINKKIETWSQMPNTLAEPKPSHVNKPLTSARDVTKDLPSEVAAFERFLEQTGGHRGGWDEYDHQTFLKCRNKHKGKPLFIRECVPSIPTRSEQQIREHEDWFQEYQTLNEKKKQAIRKWRTIKQYEKAEALAHVEEDSSSEDDEIKAEQAEQLEQERKEKLAKVNAWKVQKELEKAEQEEKRLKEELRQVIAKESERKKQIEKRAEIEKYRQQKQEEEDILKLAEEMQEEVELDLKRQQRERDMPRLQQRNQRILEQKLEREKAKVEAEKEKRERLERIKGQVEVDVKRDPSRLYKMTKGWEERNKSKRTESGGPVLHMPHRAVPSWRAGLH